MGPRLRGFVVDGASLVSSPAGADLLSLSCQRKVSKERRARDGAPLLEFLLQGGEGGLSGRSEFASFPCLRQKFKAPSRAGTSTAKPSRRGGWRDDGLFAVGA
ncbi:hypothetical protein CXP34_22505 [Ralstonia mannitolilytica]|nr:hypothetical protein CXP34_22505 [Ralstonia mannitolilytica]